MTATSCRAVSSSVCVNPDRLSVLLRTLALIAVFQAAGAAFFMLLFGPWLARSAQRIRRLGWQAALCGVLLIAVQQWLRGARMAGDYDGLMDSALQRLAWGDSAGAAAGVQIIALGVIAAGLARPGRTASVVAAGGAVLVACAFALTGHTSEHGPRALLAPLLCVHLLIVAFWFGALLPLFICSAREARSDALALLRAFSGVAGWLVPAIAVAGLAMALILIPGPGGWRAPYGLLLLAKLGAFGLLLVLAAWNRWWAVPALAAGNAGATPTALRRSIAIEYLLLGAVLAITALLTSFYSP
jgi:putative copper resistance protein D